MICMDSRLPFAKGRSDPDRLLQGVAIARAGPPQVSSAWEAANGFASRPAACSPARRVGVSPWVIVNRRCCPFARVRSGHDPVSGFFGRLGSLPEVHKVCVIRQARADDLPVLRELERAAGEPFRDLVMDVVADDDPPTVHDLAQFQQAGRAWVYVDAEDRPVAYLLLEVIDGYGHIEQVSVHPEYARQGLGRQLLDVADEWARRHDLHGLTLTTYAHVPWNAPYYERLGFRVLNDMEITDGIRVRREHETAKGLDAWPRAAMMRERNHEKK